MTSVVVYGSRYGNTKRVAETIARVLAEHGPAQVLAVEETGGVDWSEVDLVVVGGPTEGHGVSQPVKAFFEALPPRCLWGKPAAAFDTRLRWPRWLSGSAAAGITRLLEEAGAKPVATEASFLVAGSPPVQEPGELERASAWAAELAAAVASLAIPSLSA